ncbi:MAG TPA: hypothetical protein VLM89_01055, partial [Phycisphaerae bacterium]|nr:hypothetical protein [Phycisphaerae bacterium]
MTATDNVQTETMVLTGGLVLNGAGAKLTLTGDSTSAIAVSLPTAGKGIEVNTDGGEIILNSSVTLSGAAASISMAAGAGDLTLDVALGKTLAGTVDVNDNTLTLADRGNPGIIQMDTAGGVLDVNATCAPTAVNVGAKVTIDLAGSARLNINVGIGTYTLTLTGGSVVLQGSASGGSGQYTYSWSPTAGLSDPSSATPTASPTETTTYTLTVTDTGDNN